MILVNATEFKNNLGQYLQKIYAEPVVVNKMGRPTAVLISYEAYTALMSTKTQNETHTRYEADQEQALLTLKNEFKRVRASRAEARDE
jgi:prevent-host-death family protein